MNKNEKDNHQLPIFEIPDMVLLPGTDITLKISKPIGREIHKQAEENNFEGIALTLKDPYNRTTDPQEKFYEIGTLVRILSAKEMKEFYQLKIDIKERIKASDIQPDGRNFKATYTILEDEKDITDENIDETLKHIHYIISEINENFQGSEQYIHKIKSISDINKLIAHISPYLKLSPEEKQKLLETISLKEKSLIFLELLNEQKESIKYQMELASKVNDEMSKKQREMLLREQLRIIKDELNESHGPQNKKSYAELIEEKNLPEDIKQVALAEVEKLERQGPHSPEENIIRSYLDLILALPWNKNEIKDVDIEKARETLNNEHYGLDKVKDRIIQHLTVMKLKQNKQGSILLLVGPPGTGKTSLGKSIANSLEREYVRISLGGIKDESEIRGHRRTYIGALPGRIINAMKKAKETNPVFILDEVDKLVAAYNGDPSSALLEVLDPEQNDTFSDHYLEVPYDLSDVFFIATANSIRDMPRPLLDRMEIIEIGSYTTHEKLDIAKKHLIKEVLDDHGLNETQLQFEDDALKEIISKYTQESGVRGLKKQLATIARITSEKVVLNNVDLPYIVKTDILYDLLGHEKKQLQHVKKYNPPGVVTGLAWTPIGGEILYIEGAFMPGKGKLTLTGQLGDVMKESAKISQTLIRSRMAMNLESAQFDKKDLHIHVPSGSIPKDGPSAGVALLTTIASLVTNKEVNSELAMTGEISLRGDVLPVGGIKEKVLAAHSSGIKHVILPKDNEKDLDNIPDDIKDELEFILVERIEDVLKETLDIELAKPFMLDISNDSLQHTNI